MIFYERMNVNYKNIMQASNNKKDLDVVRF